MVRVELNGHMTRIMDALGDPPDIAKLDYTFWSEEEAAIIRALRPEIERMVVAGAETTFQLLPVQFDWALAATEAAEYANTYVPHLVAGLNKVTQRHLQIKLRDFFLAPTTRGELEKSLRVAFGKTRAQRIAVTEVTRAAMQGERIAAKLSQEAGLELEAIWHTNRDELVCPLCGPLDGEPESRWASIIPGTGSDNPPQHVNCRCWITHAWDEPVVEAVPVETAQTIGEPNAT